MFDRIAVYWKKADRAAFTFDSHRPHEKTSPAESDGSNEPGIRDATTLPSRSSIPLQELGLFSSHWMTILQGRGVETADDLLRLRDDALAPLVSPTRLRRWQYALRLSRIIDRMEPWHALVLFAIHRRSPNKLAGEHPLSLHRDMVRWSWSSAGQRLLGRRRVPTLEQVETWITAARQRQQKRQQHQVHRAA